MVILQNFFAKKTHIDSNVANCRYDSMYVLYKFYSEWPFPPRTAPLTGVPTASRRSSIPLLSCPSPVSVSVTPPIDQSVAQSNARSGQKTSARAATTPCNPPPTPRATPGVTDGQPVTGHFNLPPPPTTPPPPSPHLAPPAGGGHLWCFN